MVGRVKRGGSVLAVVMLLSVALFPNVASATFPGANGKIAFTRAGNVWVMNPDGSAQVRLTRSGRANHPRWSPDGRKIAYDQFSSSTGLDVRVMNADGSGTYRVTKNPADDFQPAWSPDGGWLVFSSDRNGRSEIFKIRSRAPFGTPVQLTHTAGTGEPEPSDENPYLADRNPNWSPSGDRIVFSRYSETDPNSSGGWVNRLYAVNPNGSGVGQVSGDASARWPNWSPGGARVAWTDTDYDYWYGMRSDNIWHSTIDGSSFVQVTHFPDALNRTWALGGMSWSPYLGKVIVFSARRTWTTQGSIPDIYRVASDGRSAPVVIAYNGQNPDWGPAPS